LAYHESKYVDLIEETMYNALLGATDLEAKNYYYDNPLDENKVRYAWHVCPCCVGNIPRTLLMMPTWMYTKSPDSLYVNLFVGSTITVENVGGVDVEMVQATEYPWKGNVSITVNPKTAKNFSLRLRVPDRGVSKLYSPTPEANGVTSIHVNGEAVKPVIENGYAVITRTWKAGDKVEMLLPLRVQRVYPDARITSRARGGEVSHPDAGKVALKYGPVIYNFEKVDQDISKPIDKGAPLSAEFRPDLLGGVTAIKGKFADGSDLLAVPNYARTNRDGAATPYPQTGVRGPRPLESVVWIREA
ncbi:MAG TPA: beta-L-arabinofuranosidase domain-containing protein, partial [Bryobacteraceae bacterium]|nr:beta-L-arabinofuranosidase domain-containing protein [Bryobacteraceae bacterium]